MKRLLLILSFCICFCIPAFSQEVAEPAVPQEPEQPDEYPQSDYVFRLNQQGDSFLGIQLSVQIPFIKKLNVGGAGGIMFSRFLTDYFALGGELDFSYETTIGSNVYYFIPILVKGTFVIPVNKFEFPISLAMGFAFQSYINRNYYGFVIKPEIGAFYRFSPGWSVGLTAGVNILPQWYIKSSNNRTGVILSTSACVRFHF
jgi:hypothetical protein